MDEHRQTYYKLKLFAFISEHSQRYFKNLKVRLLHQKDRFLKVKVSLIQLKNSWSEHLKLTFTRCIILRHSRPLCFSESFGPFITSARNKPLLHLSAISASYASAVKKCTWFFICFSPPGNARRISEEKLFLQSDRFISFCWNLSDMPSFNFPRPGCYCTALCLLLPLRLIKTNEKSSANFQEQHDSSGCNFCMILKFVVWSHRSTVALSE